jgi:hypothetical protein
VKIRKAIKIVRKLAKAALHEVPPPQARVSAHMPRHAVKLVKALLIKFDDDFEARSETTSLRQAATVIAGHPSAMRLDPASALEAVARLALSRVVEIELPARSETVCAVAIVRALAEQIRVAARGRTGRRRNVVMLRMPQPA